MWSIGRNSVRLLWVYARFHDGAVQSMSLHIPRASNASCGVPYAFAGSQGYMVSGGCDGITQYVRLRQPEQASASFEGGTGELHLPPGQALAMPLLLQEVEGHERCRKWRSCTNSKYGIACSAMRPNEYQYLNNKCGPKGIAKQKLSSNKSVARGMLAQ